MQDSEIVQRLQKSQNTIMNLAYSRAKNGLTEKEIREYLKTCNISDEMDSWFIQCAIKKGIGLFAKDKATDTKSIFGGKVLWNQLIKGKITKTQWKEQKLKPLVIQGESPQKGNRKFKLDIENNLVMFKVSKCMHLEIKIPKISKNQKLLLIELQKRAELKEVPFQIQLDSEFIYISFEQQIKESKKKIAVSAGIDLNPNYLGLVISKDDKVIHQQIFNFAELNKCKNTNKIKHEKIHACKEIHKLLVHYGVSKLCLEDLNIKSKEHNKGKTFNKLVNNQWHRKIIIEQLTKRCDISGIFLKFVNPVYSSFIGNLIYKLPDALSSALEILRRGSRKSSGFYPKLICVEDLSNRWKEATNWKYQSWIELYQIFKSKNLMKEYRVPMTSKDCGYKEFISPTSKVGKYVCYEHTYFSM